MMSISRISLIVSLVLALALAAGAGLWVFMDDDDLRGQHDQKRSHHEDVLKYHGSEAVLPFDRILAIIRPQIRGEIIKTEFEIEDGIPVYEIKYIRNDGQVVELYVDARNGRLLKEEQD